MNTKTKFAEFHVSEWENVEIEMIIRHPKIGHSVTSRMVMTDVMMEDLIYLFPHPESIDFMPDFVRAQEMYRWRLGAERARKMVDMLATQMSHHICKTLAKGLDR